MKPIQKHIHIASYITAAARAALLLDGDTYYCDTDSVVRKGVLPEQHIDNKVLGKWKKEGSVKEAIFVAPKFYYLKYSDDHECIKIKGINSRNFMGQSEIWFEWMKALIGGKKWSVIGGNLQFQRKLGSIFVNEVMKVLIPRNLKRQWEDNDSTLIPGVEEYFASKEDWRKGEEKMIQEDIKRWKIDESNDFRRIQTPNPIILSRLVNNIGKNDPYQAMSKELKKSMEDAYRWLGEKNVRILNLNFESLFEEYL